MPIYPVDSHIELRLFSRANSLLFMNVLHFRIKAELPNSTTIREQIRTTYLDSYRLPSISQVRWFAIQTRNLDEPGSEAINETFTERSGAVVSAGGPEFLSSLIVLRHDNPDRKPGRMYSPIPPPGQYVLGVMDEQHRARLQLVCDGLTSNFAEGGANPFLEQQVRTRVPEGANFNPVTLFTFRAFYATQTKRRARVVL